MCQLRNVRTDLVVEDNVKTMCTSYITRDTSTYQSVRTSLNRHNAQQYVTKSHAQTHNIK